MREVERTHALPVGDPKLVEERAVLVTIGLMYEQAYASGRGNTASGVPVASASPIGPDPVEMRGDDLAFVSALTEGAQG